MAAAAAGRGCCTAARALALADCIRRIMTGVMAGGGGGVQRHQVEKLGQLESRRPSNRRHRPDDGGATPHARCPAHARVHRRQICLRRRRRRCGRRARCTINIRLAGRRRSTCCLAPPLSDGPAHLARRRPPSSSILPGPATGSKVDYRSGDTAASQRTQSLAEAHHLVQRPALGRCRRAQPAAFHALRRQLHRPLARGAETPGSHARQDGCRRRLRAACHASPGVLIPRQQPFGGPAPQKA